MYRIEDNVYTKETRSYGKSLFAVRDFKENEIVFVAFGPLVTDATTYTIPINDNLKINPKVPEENLCQFICHSCEPNLGIKNRTCFVAMRDIKKNEEVCIDYAMIGYEYGNEITDEERICKCGTATCRGKMGCYKELSSELKEKYKGYVSDYLLDK